MWPDIKNGEGGVFVGLGGWGGGLWLIIQGHHKGDCCGDGIALYACKCDKSE